MAAAGAAVASLSSTLSSLKLTALSFTPRPSQGLPALKVGGLRIRCVADGGEGSEEGYVKVARVSDASQFHMCCSSGTTNVVLPSVALQDQVSVGLQLQLDFGDGERPNSSTSSVDSRERIRREKIAHANKGKVPWNKGRRHSPETIAKIKERTRLAMLNPQIRNKLRQCGKNQSTETKAKIREKMVGFWEAKRMSKEAQDLCLRNWREMIAEAARMGAPGDEEYEWDSYKNIKEQYRLEELEAERQEKLALKDRLKVERRKKPISDAHRKAISDAIRAKWADPAYQARVSAGMAKIDLARRRRRSQEKRVRVLESSNRKIAITKSPSTVAKAEEIQVEKKKPLQVLPVDEDFIAEVLAEEVTLKTRSERSTAARIKGPQKVTLVSLEDHNLSSKDVNEAAIEDQSVEQEEVALSEGSKTAEGMDVKTPSLRPEGVQLSSKLTSQSYKDPFVLEKLHRIQQLRKGRLEVELKRKEAADRARMLIADAERAASALEQSGSIDAATMATLIETRRLLAEATRSMRSAEMKQGTLGKSRNPESQDNDKLSSLTTSNFFHSRIWSTGDKLVDCPHPIPIRIGSMRSRDDHQLHLDKPGGNPSSSGRSSRWATSPSEEILEEETHSSTGSDTEESQAGSTQTEFQNWNESFNSLAGQGASNLNNRSRRVWHGGRFSVVDVDERT